MCGDGRSATGARWLTERHTVIDTSSKIGFAKLYTRKTPLTAADILNDRVIPFFDEHEIRIDRILTDRGTEYCGAHDRHEYELYLAVEDIDHSRTKVQRTHQGRWCFGKTPMQTFLDSAAWAREKQNLVKAA